MFHAFTGEFPREIIFTKYYSHNKNAVLAPHACFDYCKLNILYIYGCPKNPFSHANSGAHHNVLLD